MSEMPTRIARLPKDHRGYPVPWFVQWIEGKPQFPVVDASKYPTAIKNRLCWVCGDRLGSYLAFVAGPMCGITRTSAEPPSHLECAEFSVKTCPFLTIPKMKRIENEVTKQCVDAPGIAIKRNPGVALVWVTKRYSLFRAETGALIQMGEPEQLSVWSEGRRATGDELNESIKSGLPILEKMCNGFELEQLRLAEQKFYSILERVWRNGNE